MREKSCLIVVDVQNDFMRPSGALSVPNSEEIIEDVNCLVDVISRETSWSFLRKTGTVRKHSSFANTKE